MDRSHYKIFSKGAIAGMTVPNRFVRSATWDPCILAAGRMTEEVLDIYRDLALGGAGLVISGGLPVYRQRFPEEDPGRPVRLYADLRVAGVERMAQVVHEASPECKIVAQLEVGYLEAGPSAMATPFSSELVRALAADEIEQIIACFVDAIADMQDSGFDGVQLHAAHGGLLSRFLSPYSNRRDDEWGRAAEGRTRIVREIIAGARKRVRDFPILIKMNCTDCLVGGVDIESFPALAHEIVQASVDAIEISGGMWECLFRSKAELGFRPVPAPESHTRIGRSEQQSYFLAYAEQIDVPVPIILVGGNRDVERLEAIVQGGNVDFVALCRPLIREPNLPNRWRAGTGGRLPECVSCNSCLYAMIVHPGRPEPCPVTCVCKSDKKQYRMAQKWLITWKESQGKFT